MRLFRQKKLGEWGEVIERMAGALEELAAGGNGAGHNDCQPEAALMAHAL